MSVSISRDAQRMIDRLEAVDHARPAIDTLAVEAAIREHFVRLGIEPLPVRWLDDAEQGISAAWSAAGSAARSAARSAAWSAARSAAESAAESAARSSSDLAALDRWIGIWLPFLDAYEAGLWIYWVLENEVLAVPRPALQIVGDDLHSEDGPAVAWPNGTRYWFWQGVQVLQHVIEQPEALTPAVVLGEQNVEVRRVMMERYGHDRLLADAGGVLRQEDEFGKLWALDIPGDEPLVMVEVVNSTAEPDGTFKDYFLRVPPDTPTARAGVAWTFDLPESTYMPAVQT